ncbi:WecB/TagA/CpsF family glycosyltransferase [Patescibacteria group bacterium]|nr:WecB/TagA/CpsF family glycosyltransferase [Patescibacteria group bacterium]
MLTPKSREIFGIRIDFGFSMQDVLAYIENNLLTDDKSHYICTTNSEFLMEASENDAFKEIINGAALSVPDSTGVLATNEFLKRVEFLKREGKYSSFKGLVEGVKLGCSILTNSIDLGDRITGVELVRQVCKLSHEKGYTIFLMGGWPKSWMGRSLNTNRDIATETADMFRKEYPNVNIIGSSSQYSYKSSNDTSAVSYIKKCLSDHRLEKLDFLFAAFNQYQQESWIVRNMKKIPARVSVGVGRSYNYYSNSLNVPPKCFTKYHLDWLYSLLNEPWRLARVLNAFPGLPLKVYRYSLKNN